MKRLLVLATICSSIAIADTPKYSSGYQVCLDNSSGTTPMIECTRHEFKLQDARLNMAYKVALKRLGPSKQDELRNIQKIWLKYIHAKCDFEYGLTGGTMDNLFASACMLEETSIRANEIERIEIQH